MRRPRNPVPPNTVTVRLLIAAMTQTRASACKHWIITRKRRDASAAGMHEVGAVPGNKLWLQELWVNFPGCAIPPAAAVDQRPHARRRRRHIDVAHAGVM